MPDQSPHHVQNLKQRYHGSTSQTALLLIHSGNHNVGFSYNKVPKGLGWRKSSSARRLGVEGFQERSCFIVNNRSSLFCTKLSEQWYSLTTGELVFFVTKHWRAWGYLERSTSAIYQQMIYRIGQLKYMPRSKPKTQYFLCIFGAVRNLESKWMIDFWSLCKQY